jgi:hypothetical protein
MKERLFVGVYSTGLSFADKGTEENGDYRKVAFMPYRTLTVEFFGACDKDMKKDIQDIAATMEKRRGQFYETSTCGQGVILGA